MEVVRGLEFDRGSSERLFFQVRVGFRRLPTTTEIFSASEDGERRDLRREARWVVQNLGMAWVGDIATDVDRPTDLRLRKGMRADGEQ